MTMPDERTRAVLAAGHLLHCLILPPRAGGFARVPKAVRLAARRIARHFPVSSDLIDAGSAFDAQTAREWKHTYRDSDSLTSEECNGEA